MTWPETLRDEPLAWLLEPENPSVRYRTLIELFDQPTDDPEVREARGDISSSQNVQKILARQDPAGWWDTPDSPYGIKRASGQLLILTHLRAPPDERTRLGCEFVLTRPWIPTSKNRNLPPCYTANCLRFLTYFGFADDPRLDAGWEMLLDKLSNENGLKCRYQKTPCHWLAVKALWALVHAPGRWDAHPVIAHTAEAILSHDFEFEGQDARWLRFGFPWNYQSDLLDALAALAICGHAGDDRFRKLTQHVREKQSDDGHWLLEGGSTAARIERKGRPSKWITLKALYVLKKVEEAA